MKREGSALRSSLKSEDHHSLSYECHGAAKGQEQVGTHPPEPRLRPRGRAEGPVLLDLLMRGPSAPQAQGHMTV